MGTIVTIHELLSNSAWIFFLIVGVWGGYRAVTGSSTDGNYLGAVAVGQLIFVAQAILGGILWFGVGTGTLPRPGIHLLYGIFSLVFLPFIYLVVLRGDDSNRAQWVWAFSTLFMWGISLRAIGTANFVLGG